MGFRARMARGKTTTLKVLSGLLHPTSGHVTVAGYTPQLRETSVLKPLRW